MAALVATLLLTACAPALGAATRGWTPVAAADGVVYVVTRGGEVKALQDSGFDGVGLKWTFTGTGTSLQGAYNPPAVGSNLIYVGAADGHLYALEKETGMLGANGWRAPQGQAAAPRPIVSGPTLNEDLGIVVVGSEDHNLYAFDARTGQELWRFTAGDKIWSTPVIQGETVYFGSHDHHVYAVDATTGEERWRFATGAAVVARPLVWRDMVIIGSFDRRLYALDVRSGGPVWEHEAGNWFWTGAVAGADTVYAPSMDGNVYALDRSGNLLWQNSMGSPIVSTPALLPRGLVVASLQGRISVLDLAIGELISTPLSLDPAEIKAPLFALPPEDDTQRPTGVGISQAGQRGSVFVGSEQGEVRRIQITAAQNQVWCFDTTRNERCN
jgi:eukaryotic-like serine/threonine-protein kinase